MTIEPVVNINIQIHSSSVVKSTEQLAIELRCHANEDVVFYAATLSTTHCFKQFKSKTKTNNFFT